MDKVKRQSGLGNFLRGHNYIVSFALLMVLAGVVSATSNGSNFFQWSNITNMFVQASVTGIIAMGMNMVISAGLIDISVGAQVALISGLGIWVLNATNNIPMMLLFTLAMGAVIGVVNGLLVAKGHLPAMIATLATQSICRSVINHLGQNQGGIFTIPPQSEAYDPFRMVAAGYVGSDSLRIPYPMIIFILIGILFGVVMLRTRFGKHIYAVGSNEVSAKLAGVNANRIKVLVFVVTGLMCGFVSFLYSSRVMSVASTSAGVGFEMDAIAAVAIGGTAMSGGRGTIMGTFLGALMFRIIENVLLMARVPTFLSDAISGGIIIVAVLLQNLQNRKKGLR